MTRRTIFLLAVLLFALTAIGWIGGGVVWGTDR